MTQQEHEKYFLGVEIEINSHCNKACSYCPNSNHARVETGHMKPELYLKIMQQLKDINYRGRICYHFYNEPMLSPQLDEFVRISKEYCPESRSELFTNGTLLTKKRLKELITSGMDKFTITKHEDSPNYIFDKVYQDLNDDEKKFIKYTQHEDLLLTNRGGLLDVGYSKKDPPYQLPCYIPTCSLVITVQGNIVTCYEDFYQKSVMGNINETHIKNIWHSEKYKNFRAQLKKGNRDQFDVCRQCNNVQIIQ